MSYAENPYQSPLGCLAAQADTDERTSFITKTYSPFGRRHRALRDPRNRLAAICRASHNSP